MTEDEAALKWCHAFTASHTDPRGVTDGHFRHSCIGSSCMAWRRSTVMIDRATGEAAVPGVTAIGQLEERYSAHGYCGLAGRAQ